MNYAVKLHMLSNYIMYVMMNCRIMIRRERLRERIKNKIKNIKECQIRERMR